MNFLGFNVAPLNGGVPGMIAGAALVLASCGATADGTRIEQADAILVTPVFTVTPASVRTVYGGSASATVLSSMAQWALLTQASAAISGSLQALATNTDAYVYALSGGVVGPSIVRPGTGNASSVLGVNFAPLVTVGYASNIVLQSQVSADASVQFNGQTTIQRDGYARAITVASLVSASSLRTALPSSAASAISSASTDSIRIQGGSATIASSLNAIGTPSTDSAVSLSFCIAAASARTTHFGDGYATSLSAVSASQTVNTAGYAYPVMPVVAVNADSRLAILSNAFSASALTIVADAIYALQGTAQSVPQTAITCDAVVYKLGASGIACALSVAAVPYMILRDGAAVVVASSATTASGSLNIEAVDPDARTMHRPYLARTMTRPFVNTEMKR